MPKSQTVKPSTLAVRAHRARAVKRGEKHVYAAVSAETHEALQAIMVRRVCTMRDALEYAVQRAGRELARVR